MICTELQNLDDRRVAIELRIGEELRVLRGLAHFDSAPDRVACLRVMVADPCGDVELVIAEDTWCGEIRPSDEHDCDYVLSLDFASVAGA